MRKASTGDTVIGITTTSNLSMMRDLLIVERNEASLQRKDLKELHDQAFSILGRLLKFNERMHRRAARRMRNEQNLTGVISECQESNREETKTYVNPFMMRK